MEVCEKKYPKTDTIVMYTKKHSISKFRQIFFWHLRGRKRKSMHDQ